MKVLKSYSILTVFVTVLFFGSSIALAKGSGNGAIQNGFLQIGSLYKQESADPVRLVGEDGIIVTAPTALQDRMPSCASGDMGGGAILNHVTTCCAAAQDAEGRSVCVGYETCDVYSINCLGDDGYYTVNGDPFNCTRDAVCDEARGGGSEQIQETQTN